MFTGFHGDKVWDTNNDALGPQIVRSDTSGTDLSEYRLWVGFANCPVPYLGVRQVRDIHAISTSHELQPWNVGGGYNRPICRRIVEEQGVPREMFGRHKKATAQIVTHPDDFLTRAMRRDYLLWLWNRRREWSGRGMCPPVQLTDLVPGQARVAAFAARLRRTSAMKRLGRRADAALARLSIATDPDRRAARYGYAFHWAVERAKERYPNPRAGSFPARRTAPAMRKRSAGA